MKLIKERIVFAEEQNTFLWVLPLYFTMFFLNGFHIRFY